MIWLNGNPPADKILNEVELRVQKFKTSNHRHIKLVVVWVGNSEASKVYTNKKAVIAKQVGMLSELIHLPETTTAVELKNLLVKLNNDPTVDGMLVQRPLPGTLELEPIHLWITPEKDVDCFHPYNLGTLMRNDPEALVSCTPKGVMALLDFYSISVAGKNACVIGRSLIVGRPMTQLLLNANATTIQVHSKSKNIEELTQIADIVVVAAGLPEYFGKKMFKKDSVVIDVGIHRSNSGKIVGDCIADELINHVSGLSPVPKGVGPMTIAVLMQNTVLCAEKRVKN